MSSRTKLVLFLVIFVFPVLLGLITTKVAFTRAEHVDFCASCHTMTPWIEDVTGEDGDSLAHDHFAHRWIQQDQCYTCHSNYGFLGPIEAKIKGMRHLIAYYVGGFERVELYGKFPNANCLKCHAQAKGFLEEPSHDPIADLVAEKDLCVDCHENLHNVEQPEKDNNADAAAAQVDEASQDDDAAQKHDDERKDDAAPADQKGAE